MITAAGDATDHDIDVAYAILTEAIASLAIEQMLLSKKNNRSSGLIVSEEIVHRVAG